MEDTSTSTTATQDQLLSFVERIESVNEEIKERNDDKRDLYAEAKAVGFDPKALKAIVARRAKDPSEVQEADVLIETYLQAIEAAELRKNPPRRSGTTIIQPSPAHA